MNWNKTIAEMADNLSDTQKDGLQKMINYKVPVLPLAIFVIVCSIIFKEN